MTDAARKPVTIRMHPDDNVAIVANDGGLPAGTVLPDGLVLREKVPQGHKLALVDIETGGAVRRYNVPVGYARQPIAAGSWVHERLIDMPSARALEGLPMATVPAPASAPLPIWLNTWRRPSGATTVWPACAPPVKRATIASSPTSIT